MKKTLTLFVSLFAASLLFSANAYAKLPSSVEEFDAAMKEQAKTPEGTVKLWLDSVFLYSNGSTRSLGSAALKKIMYQVPADFESNTFYVTLRDRMSNDPYIFRAFCAGSSPENGYKADVDNCKITITRKEETEPGTFKIFLQSSGADSPRPMSVKKDKDGLFKVSHFGSVILRVRKAD